MSSKLARIQPTMEPSERKNSHCSLLLLPAHLVCHALAWIDGASLMSFLTCARSAQQAVSAETLERLWQFTYQHDFDASLPLSRETKQNWQQHYCRRARIERNWRIGRFKEKRIELPARNETAGRTEIALSNDLAILLQYS